jgi:hypothetical protein
MTLRIGMILGIAAIAALVIAGCGGGGSSTGAGSFVVGPEGGDFVVGGIVLHFPLGTVSGPVTVFVGPLAPLSTAPLPTEPPTGLTAISAVDLEAIPAGLTFTSPFLPTITMPLTVTQTGGAALTLWVFQSNAWVDSGRKATVSSDGKTAVLQIDHFGVYALFVP